MSFDACQFKNVLNSSFEAEKFDPWFPALKSLNSSNSAIDSFKMGVSTKLCVILRPAFNSFLSSSFHRWSFADLVFILGL